ncbi:MULTISPECIES: MbeB family mobilization protein [unclassified Moraxella]|uniref:MbeB family mobilization protein n=1 Tax=unclassified Moraxella TaxID=2685852 RepID=UPI00359ED79A
MQTISDLAKTISQKTSERAENTEQIVQNELARLEKSLQQRLRESEHSIANCIADYQASLQAKLNTALAFKNWLMITIGVLLATILVLGGMAMYFYSSMKDSRAEQAEILATIEQMPLPPKVLNQFNIQQDEKYYYLATKNKKAEVFANKNGGKTIKIPK